MYPHGAGDFNDAVNAAFDEIGFSDDYVSTEIAAGHESLRGRKSKVFKDNVWGMVELEWPTLRLLDSPILQRLRGIKQLGFSYLTYPTAEHTRFAHSLGMTTVVTRFLEAMRYGDDRLRQRNIKIDDFTAISVKHAALLHDVGHLPFSHASEKGYYEGRDRFRVGPHTVRRFVNIFKDELEKDLLLAECLSLAIILSPRFRRFYEDYVNADRGSDPHRIFRIACLVAGLPHENDFPGLANIISDSSVDADKVDYINRDALGCGIPVGIDVARLFLRSSFVEICGDEITRLFPGPKTADRLKVFVVNSSGADTIEEIALARSALYHRVYFHQTTRNAERVLSKALWLLPPEHYSNGLGNVLYAWTFDDDGFLKVLSTITGDTGTLGWRLRRRHLPKRASAFGRDANIHIFPSRLLRSVSADTDKGFVDQVVGFKLLELRSEQLYGQSLIELEAEIEREAIRLRNLLQEASLEELPAADSLTFVSFSPMPNLARTRPDAIINENGELLHTPKKSTADEQSDASEIFKSNGFVLTDPQWREIVMIAARRVLAKRRDAFPRPISIQRANEEPLKMQVLSTVILDLDASRRRCGLDSVRLDRIMQVAEEAHAFDDEPRLARPFSSSQAAPLAARLITFEGEGDWVVTAESIAAFISQFPPRLRGETAELISQIRMIDRGEVRRMLPKLVQKIPVGTSRNWITNFSPNSGSFVRMLAEQELKAALETQGWSFAKSIGEALDKASDQDVILLVDDNTTSGSQASAQLLSWMGISRTEWPDELKLETNIDDHALSEAQANKFKANRSVLGFVLASEDAKRRIAEAAARSELTQLTVVEGEQIEAIQLTLSPELSSFLRDVGAAVLTHCRTAEFPTEPNASIATRSGRDALGYDGKGLAVVTPFNVPAGSITALWCPGLVNSVPWVPLLIRRGYLKHLILH